MEVVRKNENNSKQINLYIFVHIVMCINRNKYVTVYYICICGRENTLLVNIYKYLCVYVILMETDGITRRRSQ